MRKELLAGLDLGTTRVSLVVAERRVGGELAVLGMGRSPSSGLRRGVVLDLERTAQAIAAVAIGAERMAGTEVRRVCLAVSGDHIASENSRGVVAVSGPEGEITADDVARAMEAARAVPLPPGREVIHVLPRGYVVDGYRGVRDPVGMAAGRLEVEANIVTGAAASLQNLFKTVHLAGLSLQDAVLAAVASAEAVLEPAEKEFGVILADIGGGTTDVAVYDGGGLWCAFVLPLGGDYLTSDLAVGLRTPVSQAEKIKREHGWAMAEQAAEDAWVEVPGMGGSGPRQVPEKLVASILEARVEEIFSLLRSRLERSGYRGFSPGGMVLTGGTARLRGITAAAAKVMGMPVRLGLPRGLTGMSDLVGEPGEATAVGLLHCAARSRGGEVQRRTGAGRGWRRIGDLVRELLN
ncbi:MAG: cell division protein FtsA [Thermaerobacter sp.]|nr:cell division protein FtsA [Thermaerobacter sp.]